MIVGRDQKKSSAAVKELAAIGVKAAPVAADLTDEAACRSVVARTVAKFGRLDRPRQQRRHRHSRAAGRPIAKAACRPNAAFAELVRLSRTRSPMKCPKSTGVEFLATRDRSQRPKHLPGWPLPSGA
jgi:hypothetical protein